MTYRHLRRARRGVQALSFLAFTLAVILTLRDTPATFSAATAVRLDPLAASTAMVAARRWLPRLLPAFLLLGLSLVLGRAWCGWLCPLGTLIDWFAPARRRYPSPQSTGEREQDSAERPVLSPYSGGKYRKGAPAARTGPSPRLSPQYSGEREQDSAERPVLSPY